VLIHENNEDHLYDFIKLNEEWITKYFSLEEADRKLSDNPSIIIKNKGYIFSLVIDDKVVGVCALFNEGNGVFELARMAVSSSYQGRSLGKALIETCINKAKSLNAKKVYLLSNTNLKAAIGLYKKFGFKTVRTGQHPVYSRANIVMELNSDTLATEHDLVNIHSEPS